MVFSPDKVTKKIRNLHKTNIEKAFDIEAPILKLRVSEFKVRNFKANLFSENIFQKFKELSNFPEDEILKAQDILSNLNIKFVISSTSVEPIDTSHPIKHKQHSCDHNSSQRVIGINHVKNSSKFFIENVSLSLSANIIWDSMLKLYNNESLNFPFYTWVLFILFVCYLLAQDSSSWNYFKFQRVWPKLFST